MKRGLSSTSHSQSEYKFKYNPTEKKPKKSSIQMNNKLSKMSRRTNSLSISEKLGIIPNLNKTQSKSQIRFTTYRKSINNNNNIRDSLIKSSKKQTKNFNNSIFFTDRKRKKRLSDLIKPEKNKNSSLDRFNNSETKLKTE